MKKVNRVISIILLFAMLFSLTSVRIYATETDSSAANDLQNVTEQIGTGLQVKNYYAKDSENDENVSATFIKLPSKLSGVDSGSFSYNEETGGLNYRNRAGDSKSASIEIRYNGEIINTSGVMKASDDSVLVQIPESLSDSAEGFNADDFNGKELQVVLKFDDGTTATYSKTLSESDINSQDITKGDSIWDWINDNILAWVFKPVEKALKVLEEVITGLLLAFGDEVLTQVSSAVGEYVTIDKVVFGNISKVSIDFWNGSGYLASTLRGVIVPWYNTFSAIAVVVYLAILLIIGIQIVFSSTGSGMSKYKTLLVDWVVGVALLFLFPYVMKTAVDMNTSLVKGIDPGATFSSPVEGKVDDEAEAKLLQFFGANNFISNYVGIENYKPEKTDGMLYIRYLAGNQGRIPLAIVYLIMIYQLIIIIFVYYKRAFMVAFLILLFPLVAITYTLDKLRRWSDKNTSL